MTNILNKDEFLQELKNMFPKYIVKLEETILVESFEEVIRFSIQKDDKQLQFMIKTKNLDKYTPLNVAQEFYRKLFD